MLGENKGLGRQGRFNHFFIVDGQNIFTDVTVVFPSGRRGGAVLGSRDTPQHVRAGETLRSGAPSTLWHFQVLVLAWARLP